MSCGLVPVGNRPSWMAVAASAAVLVFVSAAHLGSETPPPGVSSEDWSLMLLVAARVEFHRQIADQMGEMDGNPFPSIPHRPRMLDAPPLLAGNTPDLLDALRRSSRASWADRGYLGELEALADVERHEAALAADLLDFMASFRTLIEQDASEMPFWQVIQQRERQLATASAWDRLLLALVDARVGVPEQRPFVWDATRMEVRRRLYGEQDRR